MDITRAERHARAPIRVGRREGWEQSEAVSSRVSFRQLLGIANERLSETSGSQEGAAPDGRRFIRTVRAGDTLSHLVQAALRETGTPVNAGALYRAVGIVAEANRLQDPDRIHPGQALDLSAVIPGGTPSEGNAGPRSETIVAGASESAVGVLHGLKTFMQSFAGRLTSSFGPRTDPVTGLPAFHAGVDIRMPPGSLVYPAAPGRVIFSGRTLGYGNLIILAHAGGLTTAYGHNASNLIPTGVVVDQEMPIAVVGATGKSTGTHLHFEVRKDGHPINPDVRHLGSGDQGGQQDL